MKFFDRYLLVFIIALPCFLFYQYAISFSVITPFLGGYFGLVYSLLLLFMLAALLLSATNAKVKLDFISLSIFLFFIIIFFVVIFGTANGAHESIVKSHIAGLIYSLLYILIFTRLKLKSDEFKRILHISFYITLCLFVFSFDLKSLSLTYFTEDYYFSYQYIAACIFIISTLLILRVDSLYYRTILFAITIVILFFNGARTEFAFFFAFYIIYELSLSYRKVSLYFVLFLVVLLILFNLSSFDFKFTDNRIVNLVEKGVASGSGGERIRMFADSLAVIESSPLLGDYASYEPGAYAHSIISVWADFGFFPFIMIMLLLVYISVDVFKMYYHRGAHSNFKERAYLFSLLIPLVPILFLVKNHDFLILWFFLGVYINVKSITRCELYKAS